MSPIQNKAPKAPAKSETEQALDLLKEQVKRMEEKGLTDTCHHEMLRRALEAPTIKE